MNPEPTSTEAPASVPTETLPNLAPDTTSAPAPEPRAAVNEEDAVPTNDVSNAEDTGRKQEQENSTDKNASLKPVNNQGVC